jgi:hypothetical protein
MNLPSLSHNSNWKEILYEMEQEVILFKVARGCPEIVYLFILIMIVLINF